MQRLSCIGSTPAFQAKYLQVLPGVVIAQFQDPLRAKWLQYRTVILFHKN